MLAIQYMFGSDILLLPIVKLFNIILKEGMCPDCWHVSLVLFLPKNNGVYDCNKYRCLSLSSSLGKLFTPLLQSRLHNYMEDKDLYNRFQAGFRPGYRTSDHIYTIKNNTKITICIKSKKKKVCACSVDFF